MKKIKELIKRIIRWIRRNKIDKIIKYLIENKDVISMRLDEIMQEAEKEKKDA